MRSSRGLCAETTRLEGIGALKDGLTQLIKHPIECLLKYQLDFVKLRDFAWLEAWSFAPTSPHWDSGYHGCETNPQSSATLWGTAPPGCSYKH